MRRLLPVLLAVAAVSGCSSGDASAPAAGGATTGPVRVVASTDVYGSIVSAIGGDAVQVTSFIDAPSKDPHEYSSTPADAAATAAAELAVGNGGGYDDFFFRLTRAAGGDRTVIDVVTLSGLQAAVPGGQEFNEHMWFNLPTMRTLAATVAADLSALRPQQAATFQANARAFDRQLDGLQARITAIARAHGRQRVAATEPLPLYLVSAAGLVNVTPEAFMQASEAGTDPPAAVVQQTIEVVAGPQPVGALLLNTQTENAATDRLTAAARRAGVPVVTVGETLSDGARSYVPWLGAQLDALGAALGPS